MQESGGSSVSHGHIPHLFYVSMINSLILVLLLICLALKDFSVLYFNPSVTEVAINDKCIS